MVHALVERRVPHRAVYSQYENSIGTGQVHVCSIVPPKDGRATDVVSRLPFPPDREWPASMLPTPVTIPETSSPSKPHRPRQRSRVLPPDVELAHDDEDPARSRSSGRLAKLW